MSKEKEIYKLLESQLYENKFKSEEKFYSENQLVSKYDISRLTARNVLKKLEKANFIKAKKAVGYFVTESSFWNKGASWNKNKEGIRESELIDFCAEIDDFFVKKFNLDPKHYYSYLKIRKLNGEVYLYSVIWIHKFHVGILPSDKITASTLNELRKKNDFDCSLNLFKIKPVNDLDKEIFGDLSENCLPVKYSFIQNEDLNYIQLSLERYKPSTFEHYFIQNL